MARGDRVTRPTKKSEYEIVFASRQAQKGWRDLCATSRNAAADCWDSLTRSPLSESPKNYRLRGELAHVTHNGEAHERWQHKPTIGGDARVWFFVVGQTVYLERVFTHHPNATK